jgi:hypothetical protein
MVDHRAYLCLVEPVRCRRVVQFGARRMSLRERPVDGFHQPAGSMPASVAAWKRRMLASACSPVPTGGRGND